jgi:hypothetical protein
LKYIDIELDSIGIRSVCVYIYKREVEENKKEKENIIERQKHR